MKIILFLKINICHKNYSIKGINFFFPHSGIFRAHVPHKEQDYTKDLIGSRMSCLTNEKPCCVRNKEFPCRFAFICSSIQPLAILRSEQKCCQKTLWGNFMYCVHWKIIRQTLVSPYRRDRGRLCHHY